MKKMLKVCGREARHPCVRAGRDHAVPEIAQAAVAKMRTRHRARCLVVLTTTFERANEHRHPTRDRDPQHGSQGTQARAENHSQYYKASRTMPCAHLNYG